MAMCRVFERPDGTLAVVHPAPEGRRDSETEDVWLARVWAETVEKSSDLAGLPFHDMDDTDLPPRAAPCQDGCGEEHPVRNLWRMMGTSRQRKPAVDRSARNLHAEHRHLQYAEDDLLEQDDLDGTQLAIIWALKERIKRHFAQEAATPPRQDHVARITQASLAARAKARI